MFDMRVIIVMDAEESVKWLEQRQLAELRMEILSQSISNTKARLARARAALDETRATAIAAAANYQEALIRYADDEADDFDSALEKAQKFERIETEYLDGPKEIAKAEKIYEEARTRVDWEITQAKKAGIIE